MEIDDIFYVFFFATNAKLFRCACAVCVRCIKETKTSRYYER